MKTLAKWLARHLLPGALRRRAIGAWQGHAYIPPVGFADLGDLRRVTPISRSFGADRGTPVDRYYIENFLERHRADVKGRVLEIAEASYTERFGGAQVTKSEVLHAEAGNPRATLVGDLTTGENLPSDAFDCLILTQTLPMIYDVRATLQTIYRILKPGGVVLVTVPGVAHQISRQDMDKWGDYWRFTSKSIRRLFEEVFPASHVQVEAFGNPLTALALLHGLVVEELTPHELDHWEADYEVSITVRAVKPEATLAPFSVA
ncbi:MAG: methyltransferase domain-containing protein [Acidobacteria bacterium]|nr:methyltransferase domain-containing protein [Acidobacteriota bacterium]MBI3422423.1 methyltransferase domain-containing protein [Acidobacteriota bacterium]